MTITLYNTKSRSREVFTPIDANNVRMYVCGPTVYDRAHLGNARAVVVFDMLFRVLRHRYGADHVTYVRNFTDVDDKINDTALARQQAGAAGTLEDLIAERTEETIAWYLADMGALGALEPTHAPRATGYIAPMITMIEELIENGHAYAKDGHALFRVRSYKDYGKLSGRSVDDMIAGARVEVAPFKEDPMDFVLWKPSSDDQPGWDSPWGRGRPGWHIECSAMAADLLGEMFDIHGGGNDLTFPHHENEIAQSACVGHGFAKVWMHNEMLQVEGKKMSKSLGNFFTVRDLLDEGVPGEVIRFVMLSTHYRKPMDWTEKKRAEAEKTLRKWYEAVSKPYLDAQPFHDTVELISDDLNTAGALAKCSEYYKLQEFHGLKGAMNLLGLLDNGVPSWATPETLEGIVFGGGGVLAERERDRIVHLIQTWESARKNQDWDRADEIKSILLATGLKLSAPKTGPVVVDLYHFNPSKLEMPDQ